MDTTGYGGSVLGTQHIILEKGSSNILCYAERDEQHAYILSESSLFISKRRLILKTCGTTTVLASLDSLLALAKKYCNCKVVDIFYSRKNFMRPDLQHSLYKSFEDEVKYLDSIFDRGAAYVLGRMNGDCWYLYTLDDTSIEQPDQTLEMLMTDLDDEVMAHFQNTTGRKSEDVTKVRQLELEGNGTSLPGTWHVLAKKVIEGDLASIYP
eukprot:XP_011663533.1 PREDICTED: S-adenosylmethionine decarboxylase proenzyme-like [Strongylocentrotus purpuratus]